MPVRTLLGISSILAVLLWSAGCGGEAERTTPAGQAATANTTVATQPSTPESSPAALDDNVLLIPWDEDGFGQYRLYLFGMDGSAPRRLIPETAEIDGSETQPAWSPDGRQVAFIGYRDGGVDLFVVNADGTDLRNLTNGPGHFVQPSWSPDGTRIAFVGSTNDGSTIYIINADGSDMRRLTRDDQHKSGPAWSPDGGRVAFVRSFPGLPVPIDDLDSSRQEAAATQTAEAYVPSALFTVNADGSDERLIATLDGYAFLPIWSPDGSQIALSTRLMEVEHAYVVAADGSGTRPLADERVYSSLPAWSPDGARLSVVVIDPSGSQGEIVVMNVDGSDAGRLTEHAGWHAWSPDGARLAIVQLLKTIDGGMTWRSNLYALNADGSEAALLLEDALVAEAPAWQPSGS
jgi:TolB protein